MRARRTMLYWSAGALFVFVVVGCAPKSPSEVAQHAGVQVSDGFRLRGGTAIDAEHVVTDLDLTKGADTLKIATADGKMHDANVMHRDADRGIAVLLVRNGKLDSADVGDSGALKVGDILNAYVYDKNGKGSIRTAKFSGFRASAHRAYLEVDLVVDETVEGAGLIDRNGKLVGVMQFKLTPKLNYALPIEYVSSEAGGAAVDVAHQTASAAFIAQRDAALVVEKALEPPLDYAKLENVYSYSRTALVGKLTMLDDTSAETHKKPVHAKVTATNADRASRVIAELDLDTPLTAWSPLPADKVQAKREELSKAFGETYVRESFDPYAYGELRYRIPLENFCKNVTADEVHNVVLTLADKRTTGDFGYADMVNVCAAQEDGDGTLWEREWGMVTTGTDAAVPGQPEPGASPTKDKGKAKGVKAKMKAKGKTKKRR